MICLRFERPQKTRNAFVEKTLAMKWYTNINDDAVDLKGDYL